jgi:hypothetical protein
VKKHNSEMEGEIGTYFEVLVFKNSVLVLITKLFVL